MNWRFLQIQSYGSCNICWKAFKNDEILLSDIDAEVESVRKEDMRIDAEIKVIIDTNLCE